MTSKKEMSGEEQAAHLAHRLKRLEAMRNYGVQFFVGILQKKPLLRDYGGKLADFGHLDLPLWSGVLVEEIKTPKPKVLLSKESLRALADWLDDRQDGSYQFDYRFSRDSIKKLK